MTPQLCLPILLFVQFSDCWLKDVVQFFGNECTPEITILFLNFPLIAITYFDVFQYLQPYRPYSGMQYSPLDMAEYVFWTGDERGATSAIEEFLQDGLVSNTDFKVFGKIYWI